MGDYFHFGEGGSLKAVIFNNSENHKQLKIDFDEFAAIEFVYGFISGKQEPKVSEKRSNIAYNAFLNFQYSKMRDFRKHLVSEGHMCQVKKKLCF